MERLPDEATLEFRLARDDVDERLIAGLAERVAAFHAQAERGEHIAACGRWDMVSGNCRENFEQSAPQIGTTLSAAVYERIRDLTGRALERLRPSIERRAEAGVPCDTHGDLRLDHVYVFPNRPPPRDLVVVDCIEFNERFRYADPVADMAFLAMDLAFQGRRDLTSLFAEAYFRASRDAEGRELLSLYTAYRAAVRGKVEGFETLSREVPELEREDALRTSRAHWLLALVELEEPDRKPCLVLVAGLPGTGKSTLARGLAEEAGFEVVASDTVRKELAGLTPAERATADFGEGLYTPEWNERTYAECLSRATRLLFEGRRVIVDASFREDARRREFLETARAWGVPGLLLLCTADPKVVRDRLRKRKGDVSDADWEIYTRAAERWEEMGPITRKVSVEIPTGGGPNDALSAALAELSFRHLETFGTDSPMKVRDAVKLLERDGWRLVAMRGSHRQFKHPVKQGRVTVAGSPVDDLAPGTWKSILKQAKLEGDG
jgi:aminoglycoside phosphotransferase family enzyme/predicted kinase/predicted RNA binding protein YcfA (HicA-like mRNA interferase family)